MLEQQFGQAMRFSLSGELYLNGTLRSERLPSQEELSVVYRTFFFEIDGKRRETSFVYFNVYRSSGTFYMQLYFDPQLGRVVRGTTERH